MLIIYKNHSHKYITNDIDNHIIYMLIIICGDLLDILDMHI